MTREEKKFKMLRMSKRIDRYYALVEHYGFSSPHKLILCCLKGAQMVAELNLLAHQPTDDIKLSFKERIQQKMNND